MFWALSKYSAFFLVIFYLILDALQSYFNHVIKYSELGNKYYFLFGKREVLS